MKYTNEDIYVVVSKGAQLPASCIDRRIGEGVNRGQISEPDGRAWTMDAFRGPKELRDIVHAEDSGDLAIVSRAQFRKILSAPSKAEPVKRKRSNRLPKG